MSIKRFLGFLRFWSGLTPEITSAPEYVGFELLHSEYLSMKDLVKDPDDIATIESLEKTKDEKNLTWKDLYQFELILLPHFSHEQLRSKIIRFRLDYQSIASEKEYAAYQTSKPPEVQSPPDFANLNMTKEEYNDVLREDFKNLLGRTFLKYAILPIREKRLISLTRFAAALCLIALLAMLGILLVVFVAPMIDALSRGQRWADVFLNSDSLSSLTIFVAVATGAMGGFVSALQRIQSPPTEGDSLYNLSLLFHGSNSVFVAPITGAIFATLLYLMFAAGVLQGTFFPNIFTPGKNGDTITSNKTGTSGKANSEVTPTTSEAANASDSSNATQLSNSANGDTNTINRMACTPTLEKNEKANNSKAPAKGLNVFEFLARSGPVDGEAYALLIIWCFIAGFAERFVPDALDRLISNKKPSGDK